MLRGAVLEPELRAPGRSQLLLFCLGHGLQQLLVRQLHLGRPAARRALWRSIFCGGDLRTRPRCLTRRQFSLDVTLLHPFSPPQGCSASRAPLRLALRLLPQLRLCPALHRLPAAPPRPLPSRWAPRLR